jgi:hypothetical protein
VTQGLANFYPGVAWTDPEFLKAGQTLNDIAPQMILDPIVLGIVFLGWYLGRKPGGYSVPESEHAPGASSRSVNKFFKGKQRT